MNNYGVVAEWDGDIYHIVKIDVVKNPEGKWVGLIILSDYEGASIGMIKDEIEMENPGLLEEAETYDLMGRLVLIVPSSWEVDVMRSMRSMEGSLC